MQIITKKARLVWKNPYVTDGLVAMWDGQWNAGGGIHSPYATIWKDLVGSHDLNLKHHTISNFTWIGNGLRHIGSNYDIAPNFTMFELISPSVQFSISYLVNIERINAMGHYMPFGLRDAGIGFVHPIGRNNFFASLPWATGYSTIDFDTLIGHDMMFTVATDGMKIFAAHNGVRFGEGVCGDYQASLNVQPFIFHSTGQNPTVENSWICTIRRVLIYNRPLSSNEDGFNYAIDKIRFHLS